MLPFDQKDKQQIERKRHIGNDVVVIVFVDGDTSFSPISISSKFNTIFIIVRKLRQGSQIFDPHEVEKEREKDKEKEREKSSNSPEAPEQVFYQIGITARSGVPFFGPALGTGIFRKDNNLREWLYAKRELNPPFF